MRYLQLTATPPLDAAPPFFGLIADSDLVREARVVDWTLSRDGSVTVMYAVEGDHAAFERRTDDLRTVTDIDVAPVDGGQFYVLATVDTAESPIVETLVSSVTRPGLIVVKPIVYHDGQVHARMVGRSDALQTTVETMPPTVDVEVREIGSFPGAANAPTATLSDRQRQAVLAALDLGYYDTPAGATHEDIADRIGCAPSTASEHLKKAEAKLVRATMETDPRV